MIHICIPLLVSIVLSFRVGDSKTLRFISSSCTLFIFILILLFTGRCDNIIKYIPFTSVDCRGMVRLDKGDVFFIKRGVDSFVFSDDTDYNDLKAFLEESSKNVYLHIKDDSKIIYTSSLGSSSDVSGVDLLSVYYNWTSYNIIPKTTVRYKFLIFYMDI